MEPNALLGTVRVLSAELSAVVDACDASGIETYLVGGPVRDLLLGHEPDDLDITSSARPEHFRAAVADLHVDGADVSVFDVGELHGTTGVSITYPDRVVRIEHTTFRTERYEPGSRAPTVVFGDDLDDDLHRRDFTLNAIAMNLRTGELHDPFGGAAALAEGRLCCPDDPDRTFSEDPLRICRMVRFAATRGWAPDDATATAAQRCAARLDIVSAERISAELAKICTSGTSALRVAGELCRRLDLSRSVLGVDGLHISGDSDADPDVLWAVLASAANDPAAWLSWAKTTKQRAKLIRRALDVDESSRVELRAAGRRACEIAAGVAELTGSDTSLLRAALDDDRLFAPLPVNGSDVLAAGFNGPDVGAALEQLTSRFVTETGFDRREALAALAAM